MLSLLQLGDASRVGLRGLHGPGAAQDGDPGGKGPVEQ
jgi:hypothetical protein